MKQKIQFTGKNLNDIFYLPCVAGIEKKDFNQPFLFLKMEWTAYHFSFAYVGDWLVEEDDGTWSVERGGGE